MTSIAISMNNNNRKGRNNNYVAISDYRAALSGIENRFHQIQEGFKTRDAFEENLNGHELVNSDTNNNGEVYGTLLETTKESLQKHLERIVRPMDNEEYNAMLRIESDYSNDDAADNDAISDLDDDDYDLDHQENDENKLDTKDAFDPDELLDQDAVLRVTKLREEIRLASEQLALYRDSVTIKALQLAEQQIRRTTTTQDDAAGTPIPIDDQQRKQHHLERTVEDLREEFASAPNPNAEMTQLLTDRLNQLTQNLNTLDLESPAQLLQETLDTVELVQHEPLSQTERAIRSRDNEGMQFSHKVVEDPVERLNLFLG